LQVYQITPHDHKRILAVLPSFHITGLVHLLHLPLLLNAEVYFLPTFTMKAMLDTVVEYQIPELLLVPPILIRMVRDPIVDAYDLSFLRRFSSGAAPLSPEILHLLRTKFPHTGFKQGYGMTESCSCITAHPPSHYSYTHAPTVGTICASTTIQLLRPDGSHCGPDEPGELCARGPQITTLGYLHDAAASRHTFDADGFLHTGDQAVFDPQTGLVTIVDRIKELIKVKGVAVAPAELEDLLLGHPRVDDVAVVGILDPYSGEVPKAFVRLREGVVEDEEDGDGDGSLRRVGRELLRFVRERKVREKALREVEFVREIPKSASGKILRRVLRERGRVGSGGERGVVVREERAKI
jgi:acyl-CoA synthetase (AMP-forming)/AMP-acid ligase II